MNTPVLSSFDPCADANTISDHVVRESWEYVDADTQHLTHNIHRYSGKFIPQIAARTIALLTRPGELVIDPYCGSGTTLVECALLGRRAVGVDLSPLAVLVARVKITPVPQDKLDELRRIIGAELSERVERDAYPLFSASSTTGDSAIERDTRYHDEWFRKWFRPNILADLIAIDHAISKIQEAVLYDVARVAFSDILRRSSNAHSGYPNVMFDKNAPHRGSPIQPFLKALQRVCEMVGSLSRVEARWSDVRVELGDATNIPISDSTADAVVSHPPYIGSIPYAEYGTLSLKWLGADPKQLDRELTGGRRQSSDVVERFKDGYGKMIKETYRILKSGGHAFLMVGNPIVRGEKIDLAEMTIELANNAGLDLVVQTERQGVNRRANKMGAEHLLFFRKP